MATPDFIVELRKLVGHGPLWLMGVTGVVVDEAGRILLHRRADNGEWSTPGGILEPGEQPATALVREILEETGVHAEPLWVSSVVTEPPFSYANGDQVQYLDIAFRCRPVGGEPRADGDESLEVRWFPIDGMPPLPRHIHARVQRALASDGGAWFVGR
ncbi:NUDIX hydrolase [Marinactinospora rubrisoli]|uniref:NUDIX domain-containing protein n=1 Tax=Marinactinospora rubrisoli TaxID=2715399 RepID=A0ABW2KBJ7_9ACTN